MSDYICGTCKYYNGDLCYCEARGEFDLYEKDTCDGWTDDNEGGLTDEEKAEIVGDREAHRIMVEGREIE